MYNDGRRGYNGSYAYLIVKKNICLLELLPNTLEERELLLVYDGEPNAESAPANLIRL